jgi:hypothetical protein
MPNKDLLDQQNEILSQFTADEDDDDKSKVLTNEDNDVELDDDEDGQHQQSADDDEDDGEDEPDAGDDDTHDDSQQQQRQPQQQRQSPTGPVADHNRPFYFKADRLGNLVDAQGKVIFPKGRSRNVFEKVKKAYFDEVNKVTNVAQAFMKMAETSQELVKRYKELKETANLGKNLGLSESEYKEALQMRALMKSDAKGAIRKILTMAHMNGTDLTELGVNQPLDPKTVAEQVLALQEARKPKPPTDEDRAKEEAVSFLRQFPDAAPHIDLVAEAKRRFPQMTLGQIWYQIQISAMRGQKTQKLGGKQRQQQRPNGSRPIPRNSQPSNPRIRDGKLSIAPVDPSQTFEQIGKDLLRDLREIEGR